MINCPLRCGGLATWNAEEEVYFCLSCETAFSEPFVEELEKETKEYLLFLKNVV